MSNLKEEIKEKRKSILADAVPTLPILPSGRSWKRKMSSSRSIISKPSKSDWKIKKQRKLDQKQVQDMHRNLKNDVKFKKEMHHRRRKENEERRLANERKAEIVQVVRNPAKLKRLKKSRKLEKRDPEEVKAEAVIYESD